MKKSSDFSLPRLVRLLPRTLVWIVLYSWSDMMARTSSRRVRFSRDSILFCRVDLLGDITLQMPVLNGLAKLGLSKGKNVSVVCDSAFYDLLADRLPDGVAVIGIDRGKFAKNPLYRFRVIRDLSSRGHDAVVQLVWSRDLLVSDSVVRAIAAKTKIGLTASYENISKFQGVIGGRFYSTLFAPPVDMKFHGSVNQWFAQSLIEKVFHAEGDKKISANNTIERSGPRRPVFYVFPGTSQRTSFKRWPEQNFARVIDRVIEWTRWECVIAGSGDEGEIIRKTASFVTSPKVSLAEGTLSLTELYSELGNASLVISNDSGPAHVAASEGTDVLVVCGGGHPDAFFPYPKGYLPRGPVVHAVRTIMDCYGCGWHCTHEDRREGNAFPCITSVTVDQVIDKLQDLLTTNRSMLHEPNEPVRSS